MTKSCASGSSCQKTSGIPAAKRAPTPLSHSSWSYSQTPLLPPPSPNGSAGRSFRSTSEVTSLTDSRLFHLSPGVGGGGFPSGYGETFCNIPGKADSNVTTSGCNRPCTVAHEAVHLSDIRSCCAMANTAYMLAYNAERKSKVKSGWSQWVDKVRPVTECRAYDVSVPCFNNLLKEKGCDRPSLTPDERECCGEIKLNLEDDIAGQRIYTCNSTPRQMPSCPFDIAGPSVSMSGDDSTVNQTVVDQVPDVDQQPPDQQPDQALAQARFRRR